MTLAIGASAQAQKDSSAYHESVIVVGDYTPVLDGVTEKVNIAPAVNEEVDSDLQPKFTYGITPRRISSHTSTTGLKAAKVIGSPTKLYNNYMRFGLGHDFANFRDFNPLIDLYYMSTRREEMSYGARLYHQTDITTFGKKKGDDSPDCWGRNRESDTRLDLFGKYILDKRHLFNAGLLLDRQYGRYYGFSDSTLSAHGLLRDDIENSDIAYAYNNIALALGAKSLNTQEGKLGYEANMRIGDTWTKWDVNEFAFLLGGAVNYGFMMKDKYKSIANLRASFERYGLSGDATSTVSDFPYGYIGTTTIPEWDNKRSFAIINPSLDIIFNDLKLHVGFALGFNKQGDSDSKTNFFPDIVASKSFMNNDMSITLGWKGGYLTNELNSLRRLNPYLDPMMPIIATVDNDLYARFRFNFSKKLMLKVTLDNHVFDNRMFFQPCINYSLGNVYSSYYMDLNKFVFGAEMVFVNDEMLSMNIGADYGVNYNETGEMPQLYDPKFTAHLGADVNYLDKWLGHIQMIFVGEMDAEYNIASTQHEVTRTLPARFGISLGVEYIYTRALSFFVNLDNVTCQRYYLWANYPSQRINAMVGLTYTFPKMP